VKEKNKMLMCGNTRVGTLIVATIYLQLIQNRYMFRIEGRTDQRNAQIHFSLINLLLFKILRHPQGV